MPTYTFHHYGQAAVPSGLSFVEAADDHAALALAREVLHRDASRRIDVCEEDRDVGVVTREAAAA